MNPREIDVLSVLFNAGKPLKASDITFCRRELTQSTVTMVLRRLLAMEYVEITGSAHSGKVYSRTYQPTPAAKGALADYLLETYDKIREIIPPEEMCRLINERYSQS